jgi:magnesium-protoporphyrin O-methyltransferase
VTNCQCEGIEACFNPKLAAQELDHYRKKGASKSTRRLISALESQGVDGMTLLDIGGGVGAIPHALLRDGVNTATAVDASSAYLDVAREEAQRLELSDRMRFEYGNFVELAPNIPSADIVTLDRVLCCFDDMSALVSASSARATHLYGLVYPRAMWWLRALVRVWSGLARLTGNKMRFFVHSPTAVDAIVRGQGFERRSYDTVGLWQVIVYARSSAGPIG